MNKIEILCFSGGGAKAVAIAGIFKKLEELQNETKIEMNIKEISGVSAGSILGLVYILGYTSDEIKTEIMDKKFEDFKDIKYTNFFTNYGIESGKYIVIWIESLITRKGFDKDITFKQLYEKNKIIFKVLATNLNKYKYTCFDYINTPDVKITQAIRFSISIPFYFCAERYENDIHVDGALIDNYPIKLYKENLSNVLGVKFINYGEMEHHNVEYKINTLDSFIYNVIYCFLIGKEKETTMHNEYKKHTIYVYTDDKRSFNFMLTNQEKTDLITLGYNLCSEFFDKT